MGAARVIRQSFKVYPYPGSGVSSQKFRMAAGNIIDVNAGTKVHIPACDITITGKIHVWLDVEAEEVIANTVTEQAAGMVLIAVLDLNSINQHLCGDLFVFGGTGSAYFKTSTRPKTGGGYEYSVAAGGIYLPSGVSQGVAAKTWATAPVGNIWLVASVSTGAISTSWAETAPTINTGSSPAILGYLIAGINSDGSVMQVQHGPINLTCAAIPIWYSGRDVTKKQYYVCQPNAAPSWQTPGSCDA